MRRHTDDGHHVVRVAASAEAHRTTTATATASSTSSASALSVAVIAVQVDRSPATPWRRRIACRGRRGGGARAQVLRLLLLQNELLLTHCRACRHSRQRHLHLPCGLAIDEEAVVVRVQIVRHQVAVAVVSIVWVGERNTVSESNIQSEGEGGKKGVAEEEDEEKTRISMARHKFKQ